jgi:hypothetical protein
MIENPNPNLVTVEIYRKDKRVRGGEKLISKDDVEDYKNLGQHIAEALDEKERFSIHRTYVKRVNLISQKPFWERYDTPHYCSPSSETYFSM